ncbi:Hypp3081 [Branchiostoma lanceolatum]|uniref:Hypp3081 protein n=1 Tax=Branchiostoma lanceolatum TaxID=7740 RepID=A0A8J9ZZN5_BRALA|nr:Hypp3081 [Branchiostoma lanceolatum]
MVIKISFFQTKTTHSWSPGFLQEVFEAGRQNEIMKDDRPSTATGTTTPGKTTAGRTTTEGTATGITTSNVNNTGPPPDIHPPNTNIVSPCSVPQLLNTRPPLNSMASQFNTNAIPSSTACNEICHVCGKELGSAPPGNNTRQAELPARQTPIPLGGPEHGVLTYQYILTLAKNRAKSPGQFFKELMGIYFTEEELLRGNLKGGGANEALNPAIIGAILEETRRQYGDVRLRLATVVNEKCCRVRSSHKRRKKKSSVALQDATYMQL